MSELTQLLPYLLYCHYDGEWAKKKGKNGWIWVSRNDHAILNTFIGNEGDDLSKLTVSKLHEILYEAGRFDRNEYEISGLSYIPVSTNLGNPQYIITNSDLQCYLTELCPETQTKNVLKVHIIRKTFPGAFSASTVDGPSIELSDAMDWAECHASASGEPSGLLHKPDSPSISVASAPTTEKATTSRIFATDDMLDYSNKPCSSETTSPPPNQLPQTQPFFTPRNADEYLDPNPLFMTIDGQRFQPNLATN